MQCNWYTTESSFKMIFAIKPSTVYICWYVSQLTSAQWAHPDAPVESVTWLWCHVPHCTMVTNVTNCHVTTHSVSPFPRLLKFSPPPLPSGASVLVSASDSEGGLDRAGAGAGSVPSLGWHEGDVVTCPRQPIAWIKHLKSRELKV